MLPLPSTLLLSLSAAVGAAALAGFTVSFVLSYADGPQGNHFTAIWICGLACVLAVQGAVVTLTPRSWDARVRAWWCWYSAVVASCGLILLVCLGIALPAQSGWACLWVVSACVIVAATRQHHQHVPAPGASGSSNEDVEQPSSGTVNAICASTQGAADGQTKASPLRSSDSSAGSAREKRACWRQCGVGCGHCVAWSSLFWVAVLGAFLVIQSAYLASDLRAFPPPGVLVSVPITLAGGGTATVKLHLHCSGPPSTPGLSTFILVASGGSPGVTMAGLADALAAASGRVCWYDRLGYGWSDGAIKPTTSFRDTEALHGLLAAAPASLVPPPFILVGHSAGGQLALQYAASYPDEVSGIALLDNYSDVAIALNMLLARSPGGSLPTHQVLAPNDSMVTLPDASVSYGATVPLLDLLRAVTPLAWARWITAGGWGRVHKHGPATAAMYGSNAEWHAQWVEVLGLSSGWTVADNLTLSNGQAIWRGAGFPDFSPKPVLLMPAAHTLALPPVCNVGTDPTISSDCVSTVQQPQQYCEGASGFPSVGACLASLVYADLYFSYVSTLSFNSTLFVQPSATHAFVWERPDAVAEQLVAKFAGV